MKVVWVLGLIVAFWWGTVPIQSAEIRAVYRTDFDSNPHEHIGAGQRGLVSRFFLTAVGVPFQHKRGVIVLEQHAAIKRFWTAFASGSPLGDVFINQVAVRGRFLWLPKVHILSGGRLKYKQATNAPGEESYLSVSVNLALQAQVGQTLWGRVFGRGGADESRDISLPETTSIEGGFVAGARINRAVAFQGGISYQRRRFDRLAIGEINDPFDMQDLQVDRLLRAHFQLQYALFRGVYSYINTTSNSLGHAYTAHGLEGVAAKALGMGFDAHGVAKFQIRKYDAVAAIPVVLVDDYAQALILFKVSRSLSKRYRASSQFEWSRNGARQGRDFYSKRVFSLAIEAVL